MTSASHNLNSKLNNTYSASNRRSNQTPQMSSHKGPSTSVALQIVRKQQSNDSKNNSRHMQDQLLCPSCLKLN